MAFQHGANVIVLPQRIYVLATRDERLYYPFHKRTLISFVVLTLLRRLGYGSSDAHLFALRQPKMGFEVTLHATQRDEAHSEQLDPVGCFGSDF